MVEDKERYCRDELRTARAAVLRQAEALPEMLFALERVGATVAGKVRTLEGYRKKLTEVGTRSPLAELIPRQHPVLHIGFTALYNLVQTARNEAMHQGAYARHLAQHAVELSLILEDAFMNRSNRISDYMVKSPVCAEPWQPISLIRQQMLTNSFSFLPVFLGDGWRLVSDYGIATMLRSVSNDGERAKRLNATLHQHLHPDGPAEDRRHHAFLGQLLHVQFVLSARGAGVQCQNQPRADHLGEQSPGPD
jgi:hypothetical protein